MNVSEQDYERLSAYIDDELSARERAELESQLASDADLRAELDALRSVVALVGTLPDAPAPRDFTLTPDMVQPRLTVERPSRPAGIVQLLPWMTAAAALLVAVIGVLAILGPAMGDAFSNINQNFGGAEVASLPTETPTPQVTRASVLEATAMPTPTIVSDTAQSQPALTEAQDEASIPTLSSTPQPTPPMTDEESAEEASEESDDDSAGVVDIAPVIGTPPARVTMVPPGMGGGRTETDDTDFDPDEPFDESESDDVLEDGAQAESDGDDFFGDDLGEDSDADDFDAAPEVTESTFAFDDGDVANDYEGAYDYGNALGELLLMGPPPTTLQRAPQRVTLVDRIRYAILDVFIALAERMENPPALTPEG